MSELDQKSAMVQAMITVREKVKVLEQEKETLLAERDALKLRVKELEHSIRVVRKAIAIGSWNIDPKFAKFAAELGKLFESQLKE